MANEGTAYSLERYLEDSKKELEAQKKRAKQTADVSYQKLLKYLPQKTAGSSIGGTESAKIAAANSYQNALSAAESEYATGYNSLMNNYRTEKKAEQDELYHTALTTIDSGFYNTADELEKYVTGFKDKVSDAQYSELLHRYSTIEGSPEQKAADAAYEQQVNAISIDATAPEADIQGTLGIYRNTDVVARGVKPKEGNNFTAEFFGQKYSVELGSEATELPSRAGEFVAEGGFFTYNGQIYYRSGGKFYAVNGRGGSETADYKKLRNVLERGDPDDWGAA